MKFGNISNDMICSIVYENEFPQWRQQSIPLHPHIQQPCWGGSKASATTAKHSKSYYGIYFSYMFCTYETLKYERLLSFSGKSFFYSHYVYRMLCHVMAFQCSSWLCIDAGSNIRSDTLTQNQYMPSQCERCAKALKRIKIYIFGILDLAWRWLRLRYSTHENTKCWTPSNGLHVNNTLTKWLWVESLKNVTLRWMIGNFQFYGPKNCISPCNSIAISEFAREMKHIREFGQ